MASAPTSSAGSSSIYQLDSAPPDTAASKAAEKLISDATHFGHVNTSELAAAVADHAQSGSQPPVDQLFNSVETHLGQNLGDEFGRKYAEELINRHKADGPGQGPAGGARPQFIDLSVRAHYQGSAWEKTAHDGGHLSDAEKAKAVAQYNQLQSQISKALKGDLTGAERSDLDVAGTALFEGAAAAGLVGVDRMPLAMFEEGIAAMANSGGGGVGPHGAGARVSGPREPAVGRTQVPEPPPGPRGPAQVTGTIEEAPRVPEPPPGPRGPARVAGPDRPLPPKPLPPIGDAELEAVRQRYGLKKLDERAGRTIAAGRTNIPGLELETLEDGTKGPWAGLSPSQRIKVGLPPLDKESPNREIKSPYSNSAFKDHAEEDLFTRLHKAITDAGLTDADLAGKTLQVHVSNSGGVCQHCTAGLLSDVPSTGVVKQFSLKHPTLRIEMTAEGGPAARSAPGKSKLVVQGGKVIE